MLKAATILVAFFLVGCPPAQGPEPRPLPRPTPAPPPDPNDPEPWNRDPIAEMCHHLQKMGCEEGEPVYNDDLPGPVDVPNQNCIEFHEGLENSGVNVNPYCVLRSPNCESIEDYRAKEPREC